MLPQIETITQSLQKMGLIKDPREAAFHPLSGGVSSDIWRVDTPPGAICVKQARRQLRVDAKWLASVERNSIEATWMRTTGALMPGTVPRVISEDRAASLFAMTYFDPGTYPTWISRLMSGDVDIDFAAEIGTQLARMHAASADSPKLAADFGHDDLFRALRIDPYLITAIAGTCPNHSGDASHIDPWRCEPQEYSGRAGGTGVSRCRMRGVWRPGIRHCILPQSPAVEMHGAPGLNS